VKNTICYCYHYSEDDIKDDVKKHKGRSLILERIVAEKNKGACECATKHPEGR